MHCSKFTASVAYADAKAKQENMLPVGGSIFSSLSGFDDNSDDEDNEEAEKEDSAALHTLGQGMIIAVHVWAMYRSASNN